MTERLELTDDVKLFVVKALACWDAPSEVAEAVKQQFGITISRQAVQGYDPEKSTGRNLSGEYRQIFYASRASFLAETAEIPVSHRSVRLRTLQRLATKAESMGNLPLVADILERAAKEMGKVYTNQREVSGPGGAPIEVDGTIRIEFVSPSDAEGADPGDLPGPVDPGAV